MSNDNDNTGNNGEPEEPEDIPVYIEFTNTWLDDVTSSGSDEDVIEDGLFTTSDLADYWGVTSREASALRQKYRDACYWGDERCLYVVAHEGSYGRNAPWRLLGTRHDVPESTRRVYRLNQIRHITWDFFDHAKKEVKSFGAENRQALVMVDANTTTAGSLRLRQAIRDYARDMLCTLKRDAQSRAELILDTLRVPRRARDEYYRYFLDGFWPYVEVMMDEELEILEALLP